MDLLFQSIDINFVFNFLWLEKIYKNKSVTESANFIQTDERFCLILVKIKLGFTCGFVADKVKIWNET